MLIANEIDLESQQYPLESVCAHGLTEKAKQLVKATGADIIQKIIDHRLEELAPAILLILQEEITRRNDIV